MINSVLKRKPLSFMMTIDLEIIRPISRSLHTTTRLKIEEQMEEKICIAPIPQNLYEIQFITYKVSASTAHRNPNMNIDRNRH